MEIWQQALVEGEAGPVGNLVPSLVFNIDKEENAAYAYTSDNRVVYIPWEKLNWAKRYIDVNHQGPELESIDEVIKEGDIIYVADAEQGCSWLAQVPQVSGALVSINPHNGSVYALIGGFDYYQSKFNRATQAKRQPGSSFKPFIYSAAIDKGYTPATIIICLIFIPSHI